MIVLYDADCGLCTRTMAVLRRLDRRSRILILPAQGAAVDGAPLEPELLVAMHARDASGAWTRGGAAWIAICREVAVLRPFALAARLPGAARLIDAAYGWVANHRQRLSILIGENACRMDRPSGLATPQPPTAREVTAGAGPNGRSGRTRSTFASLSIVIAMPADPTR